MNSFTELLHLHQELDEIFFEHQRALLNKDLPASLEKLEVYDRALEIHILDEEELLLPIYTSRVDAPQGGSPEIFFNEHRKIREYVQLFKAEFANLFAATDLDRAIIFLLDSETTFKRLMVHHDRREEKFLYPLLDEVTTDSERGEIFARLGVMPCTTRDREERLGRVPDWSASVLACKG